MYFPNAFSPYIYKKKIPFPPLIKLPKLLIFPLLSACSHSELCSAVTQFEQVTAEIRARR